MALAMPDYERDFASERAAAAAEPAPL